MALVDFAAVTGSLSSTFFDDITQNIQRSIVLPQLLTVRSGTGKNVQWDAQFGTAAPAGAAIADGADVTTFNNDTKIPAVLQYGTYHDAFSLTGKAIAAASASGNPAELAALFLDELGDSGSRLAKVIAQDTYVGTGGNAMVGLTATAGGIDSTGTYAGISRGAQTQWASTELDSATDADLTGNGVRVALRKARRLTYVASGLKNDLIVTDPVTHATLGEEYNAERRWVDEVRLARGPVKLEGGYNVLEFDGIPVIEDADMPANTILGINTNHVFYSQLADNVGDLGGRIMKLNLTGTPEEQFGSGSVPMQAAVIQLGIAGDAHKFQLIMWPTIVVRRPNSCFKVLNTASL